MKLTYDTNGHPMIDGARWHVASKDDPAACKEKGCTYVMRAYRDQKAEEKPKPKFARRKRG